MVCDPLAYGWLPNNTWNKEGEFVGSVHGGQLPDSRTDHLK